MNRSWFISSWTSPTIASRCWLLSLALALAGGGVLYWDGSQREGWTDKRFSRLSQERCTSSVSSAETDEPSLLRLGIKEGLSSSQR